MLFCNEMDDDEAIHICGAEQFSTYSGYGRKFQYTGICMLQKTFIASLCCGKTRRHYITMLPADYIHIT